MDISRFARAVLPVGYLSLGLMCMLAQPIYGQEEAIEIPQQTEDPEETPEVAKKVDVQPVAKDEEIAARLTRIMDATAWFEQPDVRVDEGVVFLGGRTREEKHKEWAGRLAGNTQDVVAVVNQIGIIQRPLWDLSSAWDELWQLGASTVRNSPMLGLGLILLILTWFAAKWSIGIASSLFQRRLKNHLLRDVAARAVAIPVFLLGLYLVLRVSGLTRLAVTVLGGTGLMGLVLGFAFRDIAENFLASILISMQNPFASGDLIEVAGHKGYVQSVNTRSTLLMTLEGNHVQIPNATIYKETITNYTANPNARFDFLVGIGYDDSLTLAQSVALKILQDHPAIVDDPEPLVLVESLGAATVNLRIYFWVDIARYSQFKVRSAIIRLTKRAFDQAGISMPDEAREVVFPAGVPVQMLSEEGTPKSIPAEKKSSREDDEATTHSAEGDLTSEAEDIKEQASRSRVPEAGQDLLGM